VLCWIIDVIYECIVQLSSIVFEEDPASLWQSHSPDCYGWLACGPKWLYSKTSNVNCYCCISILLVRILEVFWEFCT